LPSLSPWKGSDDNAASAVLKHEPNFVLSGWMRKSLRCNITTYTWRFPNHDFGAPALACIQE
jgi:hypothetical protein